MKSVYKSIIVLILIFLATVFHTAVKAKEDAAIKVLPTYRGNHQNTGIFPGPAPKKGKLKWKFKAASRIRSSPIVHKGVEEFRGQYIYLYKLKHSNS